MSVLSENFVVVAELKFQSESDSAVFPHFGSSEIEKFSLLLAPPPSLGHNHHQNPPFLFEIIGEISL